MKGWKPADGTKFPYYHPGTAIQHPKSKRTSQIYQQNSNYHHQNDLDYQSMTRLDYFSNNGKLNKSN